MNLILFEPSELEHPLPKSDRRAAHVLQVLRRQRGDTFDVGLINGPRGKATLTEVTPDALLLSFAWGAPTAPLASITLLIGLPRPQTARDILRDATTLGATAIHFVRAERSEASYAQSSLWSSGEWRRHVIAGAEQAFATQIPTITWGESLAAIASALPRATTRLALDNYEAVAALGTVPLPAAPAHVLAIGSERGWTTAERDLFRNTGFTLVHLGERVLRTETATIAALSILRARLGGM